MSNSTDANPGWDIPAARNLYNIQRWGAKYFDINDAGHVVAKPLQDAGASVDITDVIEEARGRNLKFPLLIRFQDILRHRVESINLAFRNSISEFNYQGKYRGVFPIKVNQLREVVEEILDAGKPFDFGLEVGSKPELFAGLAMQSQMGSLIICNGYKDSSFIKMALIGTKLGKKVIMVVEKLEELLLKVPASIVITHDRAFLDRITTRIVELDRGILRSYPGNFAAYEERKEQEIAAEDVARRRFEKFWAQEEVWIRRGVEARRTRNEGRVKRLGRP